MDNVNYTDFNMYNSDLLSNTGVLGFNKKYFSTPLGKQILKNYVKSLDKSDAKRVNDNLNSGKGLSNKDYMNLIEWTKEDGDVIDNRALKFRKVLEIIGIELIFLAPLKNFCPFLLKRSNIFNRFVAAFESNAPVGSSPNIIFDPLIIARQIAIRCC